MRVFDSKHAECAVWWIQEYGRLDWVSMSQAKVWANGQQEEIQHKSLGRKGAFKNSPLLQSPQKEDGCLLRKPMISSPEEASEFSLSSELSSAHFTYSHAVQYHSSAYSILSHFSSTHISYPTVHHNSRHLCTQSCMLRKGKQIIKQIVPTVLQDSTRLSRLSPRELFIVPKCHERSSIEFAESRSHRHVLRN